MVCPGLCRRTVSEESREDHPPKASPHDRGWAWVVAFGVALWNALIAGCIKSFGVLYVEWLELYQETPSTTAWVGSLFTLFIMIGAPLSGYMSDRYSMHTARRLVFLMGLVITAAMSATGWMMSIEGVMLSYGTISGIACATIDTPILNLLSQYFRKKRVLANSIGFSGSSVGGLLLPPIIAWAISAYSIRGAMLILGGLWLHVLLVAAVLRPLPLREVLKMDKDMVIVVNQHSENETPEYKEDIGCSSHSKDGCHDNHVVNDKSVNNKTDKLTSFDTCHSIEEQSLLKKSTKEVIQDMLQGSHETESDLNNELGKITCSNQCSPDVIISGKVGKSNGSQLKVMFKDYLEFLRTPNLFFLMMIFICSSFSYYNQFFVLPPLAEELGMSKMAASRLLALSNTVELFSRLAVGLLADRLKSRKVLILFISFSISSVLGLLVSFAASPVVLIAYAVLFGLFGGSFAPLIIPMTVELVPPERVGSATGLFPFLTGAGQSLGPPILGALYEWSGTYRSCLRTCALGYILAIFFLGLSIACQCVRARQGSHTVSRATSNS